MSTGKFSARPLSLTGPRPLQLVDGNAQPGGLGSPSASSCPSPTISGLSTPPPTAKSSRSGKSRRQSSISYFPSDNAPTWALRSPTIAVSPSLRRSASVGQPVKSPPVAGDRRSLGSSEGLQSPRGDRGPLTLTEKHADLLQFIAQKESKCLELRSQLAVHEAELAQLKRKWERIVSRGVDRAASSAPNSSVASPLSPLDGIKEGVQGVSRLLLGDLSSPSTSSPTVPVQSVAGFATKSRAAHRSRGHATSQSTSSVSTTGTTSTSVRLSQSSASSLAFDDPPRELDEKGDLAEQECRGSVEISPASALRAAKLHRRKSRDCAPAPLPDSPTTPNAASAMSPTSAASSTRASKRASLNLASGLPPPAIPGVGALAVQPMSSWMETVGSSVGRKWEELQNGDTFTKGQKRASVLFSDVSQSLFSALASPGPVSSSSVSISTNPFAATLSPLSTSPSPSPSPVGAQAASSSLLEDDDGAQGLGSVLVPDSRSPPISSTPAKPSSRDQSDDEWNW
ncbi:uncharacterized protein C8Q71DRAFT_709872 [Rhodofomes roseus]|uniref:DUF4048 domain-containing protein n=1 Tax=Rhodofomes roseus TaxID=34475 RepID=A0ABQ8KC25_9APHY|nr:uncharacterized protein C8Q71DRAFT_709872 [Rhodofomes roseus]KAH9835154.1 hypothetical protein C8Q71DRAFT_709872 [Rhodofomes roseus]